MSNGHMQSRVKKVNGEKIAFSGRLGWLYQRLGVDVAVQHAA